MSKIFFQIPTPRYTIDSARQTDLIQSRGHIYRQPGIVKLNDGRFLEATGNDSEVINVSGTASTISGSFNDARSGAAMAKLGNGDVLIAGGSGPGGITSETWNPISGVWTSRGNLTGNARQHGTMVTLLDGNVLFFGGDAAFLSLATEIYDQTAFTWSVAANMTVSRQSNSGGGILIETGIKGKVFVAGGHDGVATILGSSEIYDADLNTWTARAPMSTTRMFHTSTRLANGTSVLVVGGVAQGSSQIGLASCEIWDFNSNTWTTVASMHYGRQQHSAILLSDGRVLVIGGSDTFDQAFAPFDCGVPPEIYDPVTNKWEVFAPIEPEAENYRWINPGLGLINGSSGTLGVVMSGGDAGLANPTSKMLRLTTIVDNISGITSANPSDSSSVSLAGSRSGNTGTVKRLQVFDFEAPPQISGSIDGNVVSIIVPTPVYDWTRTYKYWDFSFADSHSYQWRNPSLYVGGQGWIYNNFDQNYYAFTNSPGTITTMDWYECNTANWSRIHFNYTYTQGATPSTFEVLVYEIVGFGEATNPVVYTVPVYNVIPGNQTEFITGIIPPGHHRIQFRFTSADTGEICYFNYPTLHTTDAASEWTSIFDDFQGADNAVLPIRGQQTLLWNFLGTGTNTIGGDELGSTVLSVNPGEYAAFIGTAGINTAGTVYCEIRLKLNDINDVKIEAGLSGPGEDPAGVVTYIKWVYDTVGSSTWSYFWSPTFGVDSTVVATTNWVTLRIEFSDGYLNKAYLDGMDMGMTPTPVGSVTPFVQITHQGGAGTKQVNVDYVSLAWGRREGAF